MNALQEQARDALRIELVIKMMKQLSEDLFKDEIEGLDARLENMKLQAIGGLL